MKSTFHQPEHLIWLGLVDKIAKADLLVIVDTVQYRKDYFQNRNKIRTARGWQWIAVPLKKHSLSSLIKEIEISYDSDWTKKYLKTMEISYIKAPYFNVYYPKIRAEILKKPKMLADLNCNLILKILNWFEIKTQIIRSSEAGIGKISGGGNKMALEQCKKLNIKHLLAGRFGKNYIIPGDFKKNDIRVSFHYFRHPMYKQLYDPFIPGMSSVDLLFNYGPKAKNILRLAQKEVLR